MASTSLQLSSPPPSMQRLRMRRASEDSRYSKNRLVFRVGEESLVRTPEAGLSGFDLP
jgi:hypothetical protein